MLGISDGIVLDSTFDGRKLCMDIDVVLGTSDDKELWAIVRRPEGWVLGLV
jgi:hypothetical protein